MSATQPAARRPRITLLADRRNWAYDFAARAIAAELSDEFEFAIAYENEPDVQLPRADLLHVFFWAYRQHARFGLPPAKVQKEVSSHRWAYRASGLGLHTTESMVRTFLRDAGTVTATSRRLQSLLSAHRPTLLIPNGFDPAIFFDGSRAAGPVRIGWAGNRRDWSKGLLDILTPAADGVCALEIAGGDRDRRGMGDFYREIDVLAVASLAEGEPLTLVEAMASGCFPVCVDVGIVPELVRHGENGLIVERTPEAFRAAFSWCKANPELVRAGGRRNAEHMRRTRTWSHVAPFWRLAFRQALALDAGAERPRGSGAAHEWAARVAAAASCVGGLPTRPGDGVIDLGAGLESASGLLPQDLDYVAVPPSRPATRRAMDAPSPDVLERRYRAALLLTTPSECAGWREWLLWAAAHADFVVCAHSGAELPPAAAARTSYSMQLGPRQMLSILDVRDAERLVSGGANSLTSVRPVVDVPRSRAVEAADGRRILALVAPPDPGDNEPVWPIAARALSRGGWTIDVLSTRAADESHSSRDQLDQAIVPATPGQARARLDANEYAVVWMTTRQAAELLPVLGPLPCALVATPTSDDLADAAAASAPDSWSEAADRADVIAVFSASVPAYQCTNADCVEIDPRGDDLLRVCERAANGRPGPTRLTSMYNRASSLAADGASAPAILLFRQIAAAGHAPELAGKASFKLATLSRTTAEIAAYLEDAVRLCPSHARARDMLAEVRAGSIPEKGARCLSFVSRP